MKKSDIEQYIKEKGKVNIPDVQHEFSIGYKEARNLFAEFERKNIIRFDGTLDYIYCVENDLRDKCDKLSALRKEIDRKPSLYKEAVKFCVFNGYISISSLQRRFQTEYVKAGDILDWLTNVGVASSEGVYEKKCLLTKDDYFFMFEDDISKDILTYKSNEEKNDEADRIRQTKEALEKRKEAILRLMKEKIDSAEEDDEEEEGNDEEQDEDEDFFDEEEGDDSSSLDSDSDNDEEFINKASDDEKSDKNLEQNYAVYVVKACEKTYDVNEIKQLISVNGLPEKPGGEISNNTFPVVICDSLTKECAEKIVEKLREVKIISFVVKIGEDGNIIADEYKSIKNFETVCMDIIEMIVALDINRANSIEFMKVIFNETKDKVPENIFNIIGRVLHEFQIATDEEYEELRKQICG